MSTLVHYWLQNASEVYNFSTYKASLTCFATFCNCTVKDFLYSTDDKVEFDLNIYAR